MHRKIGIENFPRNFDVVIMGAGFAGICQARHLLLKVPGIKVALIDPRPNERGDRDMKLGESMVEIAVLHVYKELGLYDYLVENHTPKAGLNFHWPKDPAKTNELDDYYHIWMSRQVPIPSFHMNRAKFERDVLKMTMDMGAVKFDGKVTDVDLTPGDELKIIYVTLGTGEELTLTAKHVVDAAGKQFIIGKKKENILRGPENLFGVDNGSAWVRVRGVDRTLFDDGFNAEESTVSRYYATNHWFGHGHWLWMIPTDSEVMELSVGVCHHHNVIPSDKLDRREKFYAFLKANHKLLYDVVKSGEDVDFHYWRSLGYRSKKMFSKDNWYVMGDAAFIIDAFYSYGTTTIALTIESVTEIIKAKLAGDKDVEEKREVYNDFVETYLRSVNYIISLHDRHLGHASVMSWRVYFEYMWWFGLHVPMYIGKWHLDLPFCRTFIKVTNQNLEGLFPNVYETFNEVVDKGGNIGFLDGVRGDSLIGGYSTVRHYDHFMENSKYEPLHCNVFVGLKWTCWYQALWYAKLQWRARGLKGLLNPKNIFQFARLIGLGIHAGIGDLIYRFKTRGLPANSHVDEMHKDFDKNYRHRPVLQSWLTDLKTKKKVISPIPESLETVEEKLELSSAE